MDAQVKSAVHSVQSRAMTLVRFDRVSLEFGDTKLLRNSELALNPNERICLIGRNGAGKSSLLKLITQEYEPDGGKIEFKPQLRLSQLQQNLAESCSKTAREVVAEGLAFQQAQIDQYHALSAAEMDHRGMEGLERLQQRIEAAGGWNLEQQVQRIVSELELPADKSMDQLSGGWRRRVALGKALVSKPELLLLDEPTNHLDISTIEWLEHEIRGYAGSVLFITHDRRFLQNLATRVVELEQGKLVSWPGDYGNFLRRKEALLADEKRANELFDKKLAEEETWVRQGIKARRTRNEGRVRALMAMREERAKRQQRQGRAEIQIAEGDLSGRKVIEARNISHSFDDQPLIDGFSIKVMRGDRIGLIGNNGVGKSTLLQILLGQLKPKQGTLKLGTNIEAAYFDQLRQQLDENRTVVEIVGGGREYININGRERHVISYLRDFLFAPKRAMEKIKILSGGERNRVVLAQLFTRPANLLVLDEPTNDLDVEMLEALEQRLVDYHGTLIVVSHDRDFLDAVVTSVLVFEADGKIREYVGGYSDWERRGQALAETEAPPKKTQRTQQQGSKRQAQPRKLSYQLQRELDALPDTIEALEEQLSQLQTTVARPDFFQQPNDSISQAMADLKSIEQALEAAMNRWSELATMQQELEPQ